MTRLTKRVVDAATAGSVAVFVWDGEIKGFGLRVAPSGTKSYVLSYRAGRGRNASQHRITIGKHGSPWTPELARREAQRLLGAIAAGEDPAGAHYLLIHGHRRGGVVAGAECDGARRNILSRAPRLHRDGFKVLS